MNHTFLQIIFWLSIYGLFHSYLFYPLLLKILSRGKNNNRIFFKEEKELPYVSLIMSLYNEEKVITEKLDCLLELNYPTERFDMFIGSDCSADRTNEIVQQYADKYPQIHFYPFIQRSGKPGVVNNLVKEVDQKRSRSDQHIFLLSDANVILDKDCLYKLVRHFKNPSISLVDTNMINTGMKSDGISRSENQYVSSEVQMKNRESKLWAKMIGPFGGCYVMRSSYYVPVPATFLVDDFYITMKVFEKGGNAINDLEAICYESISHDIKEEYKRKARISAGNFQNLSTFKHLLWPPYKPLAFAFLSHKVLRWLGPFFIIFGFIANVILVISGNLFYQILLFLQILFLIGIPFLDFLLKKVNINIGLLRTVTYFNVMNAALLQGFFKYLKGIKNNVWQPPKRT